MNQRRQTAALVALVAFGIDCRIMNFGSTSLMSNFSLEDPVKDS